MKYWEILGRQTDHWTVCAWVPPASGTYLHLHVKNHRTYYSIQGLWVGQFILKKELKVESKLIDISGQQWIGKKETK